MKRRILIMTMAASMIAGQMAAPISVLAKENTPSASYQMIYSESFGEVPNTRIPSSWGDTIEVFFKPEDGRTENWHGCKAGETVKPDSWFIDNIEGAKNNWTQPYTDHVVGWRSTLDGNIYTSDNIPAVTEPVSYYAVFESSLTGNEQFGGSTNNQPTETPATQAPATQAPATQAPATQAPATQAPATQAPATQTPATNIPVRYAVVGVSPSNMSSLVGAFNNNVTLYPAFNAPGIGEVESFTVDGAGNAYAISYIAGRGIIVQLKYNSSTNSYSALKKIDMLDKCYDIAIDRETNQVYALSRSKLYAVDFDNRTLTQVANLYECGLEAGMLAESLTVNSNHEVIIACQTGETFKYTADGMVSSIGTFSNGNVTGLEYNANQYFLLQDTDDSTKCRITVFNQSFTGVGSFEVTGFANEMPRDLCLIPSSELSAMSTLGTCSSSKSSPNASTTFVASSQGTQTPATQAPATQAPATQAPGQSVDLSSRRVVSLSTNGHVYDFSTLGTGAVNEYSAFINANSVGVIEGAATDSQGNLYFVAIRPNKNVAFKYTYNTNTAQYELVGSIDLLDTCYDIAVDEATNQVYAIAKTKLYSIDFGSHTVVEVCDFSNRGMDSDNIGRTLTVDNNHNVMVLAKSGKVFIYRNDGTYAGIGSINVPGVTSIDFDGTYYYVLRRVTVNGASTDEVHVYNTNFEHLSQYRVSGFTNMAGESIIMLPDAVVSNLTNNGTYNSEAMSLVGIPNVILGTRPGQAAPTQTPASQAPATQAPATQAPATQAPATQAPATQAPATQAPVVDNTKIVTSYGTWISGSYQRSDVAHVADDTRLCLADPIVGRSGDRYSFTFNDSNLEVIVRAVASNGRGIVTMNGKSGSYLDTMDGYTYYIIIKSYNDNQTFDAYRTSMSQDSSYINIVKSNV